MKKENLQSCLPSWEQKPSWGTGWVWSGTPSDAAHWPGEILWICCDGEGQQRCQWCGLSFCGCQPPVGGEHRLWSVTQKYSTFFFFYSFEVSSHQIKGFNGFIKQIQRFRRFVILWLQQHKGEGKNKIVLSFLNIHWSQANQLAPCARPPVQLWVHTHNTSLTTASFLKQLGILNLKHGWSFFFKLMESLLR